MRIAVLPGDGIGPEVTRQAMVEFWRQCKVIGAICHGLLVLSRAIDPATGKSSLYGAQTTALTKNLERTGYALTFGLLGRRYRTYDCYVAHGFFRSFHIAVLPI